MTSLKLDVEVMDGQRVIDTLAQRPVRLTPQGVAGVVYGGEVYPLHTGDRIYIQDTPQPKQLCYNFVEVGQPVPYHTLTAAPRASSVDPGISRWYLETNRFGHYLVFDGTEVQANRAVRLVTDEGLGVRRWDESIRPADNGESYDWFIRLEFDGTREQCLERVRNLLNGPQGDVPASATGSGIGITLAEEMGLQVKLILAEARVRELEAEAASTRASSEAETDRLRRQLATAESQASSAAAKSSKLLKQSQADNQELRREVVDLRKRIALTDPREQAGQVSAAVERAMALARDAEDQWVEAESRADMLAAQLADRDVESELLRLENSELSEQVEQTRAELTELERAPRESRTITNAVRGTAPRGGVEGFLAKLVPRLELEQDSVDELLSWPRPAMVTQFLMALDKKSDVRNQKRVATKRGWWEIPKVITGQTGKESLGRIYYFPRPDDSVFVVLHNKEDEAEQSRFIARLPDAP